MLKKQMVTSATNKKAKLVCNQNSYQKLKLIGKGTFGKVFLVRNKKNDQQYAVKEVLQDKRYKNRQLSIISRISHHNIIEMLDYYIFVKNQDLYLNLVMEYLPCCLSEMLKEKRASKKPIECKSRKIYCFQLFKALYYLQLNRICHRDLKPPNILVNPKTGDVKLCDFGSAKFIEPGEKNVAYICSRYYRAPELVLGYSDYGTEVDVWSAGCIMVEMLTCEPIFPGDSSLEQLIEIIKVLGSPPEKFLNIYRMTTKNDVQMPMIKPASWERILRKYEGEKQLLDLISKVLVYDVEARYTPFQILKHPYFHDLATSEYKQYHKTLPNLLQFSNLLTKGNKNDIKQLQTLYHTEPKHNLELKVNNSLYEAKKEDIETTPQTHPESESVD